jgi:hypothetical protein
VLIRSDPADEQTVRSFNITRKVVLTLSSIGVLLILSCRADRSGALSADGGIAQPASVQYSVTPVQGSSWLKHLGLRVSKTDIGEMGGTSIIPATPRREPEVMPAPNSLSSAMRKYMGMLRSQPQTTARYAHLADNPLREAANRFPVVL